MCIIIDNSAGQSIAAEIIDRSVSINSDGFGIVYPTGEIYRTMNMTKARKRLAESRPYVAHCRLATAGKKTISNTHPFPLSDGSWLFHNGTIYSLNDGKSNDSRQVATMLDMVDPNRRVEFLNMLDSRFLLINPDGSVDRAGDWHTKDGVHYSKDNVLKAPAVRRNTGYTADNYGYWKAGGGWVETSKNDSAGIGRQVDDSMDAVDDGDLLLIAVYGTLKSGHGNCRLLESSSFIGDGWTVDPMRLVVDGLPFLIRGTECLPGTLNVEVEVYAVDEETLAKVDRLEGHPEFYRRQTVAIELSGGEIIDAEIYCVGAEYDKGGPSVAFYGRDLTTGGDTYDDDWDDEDDNDIWTDDGYTWDDFKRCWVKTGSAYHYPEGS